MQDNANTSADTGNESESARSRLQSQLKMFTTITTMVAKQGLVKTTRIARPLIHGYVGCDDDDQIEDDFSGDAAGQLPPNQLTPGERTLLMNAGAKLAFETLELATLAYPPAEGIEPYRAVKNDDGCYPAPHLAHVMSLGRAVQNLIGEQLGTSEPEEETAETVAREPVLLTALNNDEYGYLTSPIEPRTIRRVALGGRERTVNRD